MKRAIALFLLISLATPAQAGLFDAGKSIWNYLMGRPTSHIYAAATILTGLAACESYVLGRKVVKTNPSKNKISDNDQMTLESLERQAEADEIILKAATAGLESDKIRKKLEPLVKAYSESLRYQGTDQIFTLAKNDLILQLKNYMEESQRENAKIEMLRKYKRGTLIFGGISLATALIAGVSFYYKK